MTVAVRTPAVGLTSGGEGAGVVIAGSDGLEADAGWHLDGDWDAGAGGGIVTQLTVAVHTPAVGLTSGGEGAGVVIAGSDGLEADAGWHLDGDWDAGASGGIVAQLTIITLSPAVGLTSGGEGAGVVIAGSDGLEADAGWHLDGDWDARACGGIITQLTVDVHPPTVGFAFAGDGAGVGVDRSNLTK